MRVKNLGRGVYKAVRIVYNNPMTATITVTAFAALTGLSVWIMRLVDRALCRYETGTRPNRRS